MELPPPPAYIPTKRFESVAEQDECSATTLLIYAYAILLKKKNHFGLDPSFEVNTATVHTVIW